MKFLLPFAGVLLILSCSSGNIDSDAQSLCDCVSGAGEDWNAECSELGETLEARYAEDPEALERLQEVMKECQ